LIARLADEFVIFKCGSNAPIAVIPAGAMEPLGSAQEAH
jgi:hypothetical protein